MRATLQKLSLDGPDQIQDPDVEDAFDWDPAYPMMAGWCSPLGWVSPELQANLDRVDELLDQIGGNQTHWTDEAIVESPHWRLIRQASRAALALMPERPPGDGDEGSAAHP
jgi:hypothetical protein